MVKIGLLRLAMLGLVYEYMRVLIPRSQTKPGELHRMESTLLGALLGYPQRRCCVKGVFYKQRPSEARTARFSAPGGDNSWLLKCSLKDRAISSRF